jgi:3-oxoacyl-[acyl-carrier protein] reductase
MGLEGRVALVSGGGRGIGAAICLALARDGADVAINYRRDEDAARDVQRQIEALGRKAGIYQAEISDWDADAAMVESATRDLGPISILVNNAGIASRGQAVADTDPAEMERVMRTHVFGAFYLSKLVLSEMRQQPRGDIIMISSTATQSLGANGAPYNMAKSAMEALAKTLAKEERDNDIRVNVVAPGLVETEMGRRLVRATQGIDDLAAAAEDFPFGMVCQPEDIGEMVAFLCSEGARYITHQVIYVNGGGFESRRRARA